MAYDIKIKNEARELFNNGMNCADIRRYVIEKYDINPGLESVRYWCKPEVVEHYKEKGYKKYHEVLKHDPVYKEKAKEDSKRRSKDPVHQEYYQNWRSNNKDKLKVINQRYNENNKERNKQKYHERMANRTPEEIQAAKEKRASPENRKKRNAYDKEKYHNDPLTKLRVQCRSHLSRLAKRLGGSEDSSKPCIQYIGCTMEEFRNHIESLWKEGMSWENHGLYGWHLDHIIPIASITDVDDIETIKKICHYTNYQPLWAEENLKKYTN